MTKLDFSDFPFFLFLLLQAWRAVHTPRKVLYFNAKVLLQAGKMQVCSLHYQNNFTYFLRFAVPCTRHLRKLAPTL